MSRYPGESEEACPIEPEVSPAAFLNLLGRSALGSDGSSTQPIMSPEEVAVLRAGLETQIVPYTQEVVRPSEIEGGEPRHDRIAVLPDDLSDMVRTRIARGVERLADRTMSDRELSEFSVVMSFLNSDWYPGREESVGIEGGILFAPTVRAAKYLAHTIGMLEGSLPLDSRGYSVGAHASAHERWEIVRDNLEDVCINAQSTFWLGPDVVGASVFGGIPTTVGVINTIVDRAETNHPTDEGVVVGGPFPRIAVADYALAVR